MAIRTSGLHHVTAIGGAPQRNVDFYLRALGLRLVKTTVNFDDPGVHQPLLRRRVPPPQHDPDLLPVACSSTGWACGCSTRRRPGCASRPAAAVPNREQIDAMLPKLNLPSENNPQREPV